MPTILISTNVKKKCKKIESQERSRSPEKTSQIATEITNNSLDEEFRSDLNLIINKLLVKSNMVSKTLVFFITRDPLRSL